MVSSDRVRVTLSGGAPWGFRLAGGGALPLTINKIRKKSRAHTQGLKEGDAVISINGVPVHDKSQDEALELVEQAGDTLDLEIFRGDVDELSKVKPKKPIQIPGGAADNGLILTATVDDVNSTSISHAAETTDTSSNLILTSSVADVTSDTYEVDSGASAGLTLTATVDDVSGTQYDVSNGSGSGLILTASVDDMSSSTNQVIESGPVISTQIGDVTATSAPVADDIHTISAQTAVLAEPFIDARTNSSPSRLSPNPPRVRSKPGSQVSNRTPSPHAPAVQRTTPSVSPKPYHTTSSATKATFDDEDSHREVTQEQHVTTSGDGKTRSVVQQESTLTTTTKRGPSFVKSQATAFNAVPPETSSNRFTQHTMSTSTTSTLKSTSNLVNQPSKYHTLPASSSSNYLKNQPQPFQPSPISSSKSSGNISQTAPPPVFKPTRFVPGPSKKEIHGLYGPGPQTVDVTATAMYKPGAGKENMAPFQPMFQVKNFVSEKSKSQARDIWRPNVWLPDQQPTKKRPQQPPQQPSMGKSDFSPYNTFPVPSMQPGISLMDDHRRKFETQSSRVSEFDDYYDDEDSMSQMTGTGQHHTNRLHVFAPPVEIHGPDDMYSPYGDDGEPYYDYEEEPLSPDSMMRRNKKLYADSAFYNTPGKQFPTIPEQMRLCKTIAQSLTSSANKRARGARMFMRRKRKSNKWVHQGPSEWSSSAGDVANLHELESELSPDENRRALLYFKIPNLKSRVTGDAKQTKMALSQEQFEKLRLNAKKCDHRNLPPDSAFDIVADLKAHKGRGGRMFERRRQRSDKFVIDNDNIPRGPPRSKLEHVLSQPVRQEKTPWEAAMAHDGNVDAAFSHISEMERNQKLNQILKMSSPRKLPTTPFPPGVQSAPLPTVGRSSLKSDGSSLTLKGKNFNRCAIGWQGGGEYPIADQVHHVPPTRQTTSNQPSMNTPAYGDYNNKVKAWQGPGDSPYAQTNQWDQSRLDNRQDRRYDDMSVSQWAESTYNEPRQELHQPRPKSWQPGGFDPAYRDEYEYNYVPVDNRFNAVDQQSTFAYMQPIIPGTDL